MITAIFALECKMLGEKADGELLAYFALLDAALIIIGILAFLT